jgi:hypothetical protein
MEENTYIGESVPGDVMPNPGYVWDFSPINQAAQNTTSLLASAAAADRKERLENKKYWQSKIPNMPDVWQYDFDKVKEARQELDNVLRGFISTGLDPDDLTGDDKKQYDNAVNNLQKAKILAEENQQIWSNNEKLINADEKEGIYDTQIWDKYEQDVLNPNLSIEERNKILKQRDGLVRNYTWDEILDKTQNERSTNEQGMITITQRDPKNYRAYLEQLFALNDQEIIKFYESKKRLAEKDKERDQDGKLKYADQEYMPEDFIDDAVKLLETRSGKNVTQDEPRVSSSSTSTNATYRNRDYTFGWDDAGTQVTINRTNLDQTIVGATNTRGSKISKATVGKFYYDASGRLVFDAAVGKKTYTFDYESNKALLNDYPDMRDILSDKPGYKGNKGQGQNKGQGKQQF